MPRYFQTNWISCILNLGVRCDVVSDAGHTLLLFVSSSNFSSTKLEDLPDDKNRSQYPPINIVPWFKQ